MYTIFSRAINKALKGATLNIQIQKSLKTNLGQNPISQVQNQMIVNQILKVVIKAIQKVIQNQKVQKVLVRVVLNLILIQTQIEMRKV